MEVKQQPPYPLRMPADLRSRLEVFAEGTRRSLNAEIIDRLERSVSGGSPDATSNSLVVALARAEHDAASNALQAEGRLFEGALVALALLEVVEVLKESGIALDVNDETLEAARHILKDADHQSGSGAFDAVIARAERSEERLAAARAEMRVAGKGRADELLAPERTVKFKGPSGKARKIAVTTRARRLDP